MRLLRNLVLVKEDARDEEREGGLYIPDAGETPPDWVWGEVLAAGPDCQEVQLGDHVRFHRFMGAEILYGEDRIPALALRESEIPLKELGEADLRAQRKAKRDAEYHAAREAAEAHGTGVALNPRAGEDAALAGLRDEVDAETDPL